MNSATVLESWHLVYLIPKADAGDVVHFYDQKIKILRRKKIS